MDLEKIDVVCIKTFERRVDLIEDCGARETVLVLIVFGDFKFRLVVDVASGCERLVLVKVDVGGETYTALHQQPSDILSE